MKTVLVVLIIILSYSCKDLMNLNNKIYEVQKQAVLGSPYTGAVGAGNYVDAQKDFRLTKLPKLVRNKIYSSYALNDTIFITESFDEICINCSSNRMSVILKDTVYSITAEILGHKGGIVYNMKAEPFDLNSKDLQFELRNSESIEIVNKIRRGESWTKDPLQYGADNCNDGDHTIMTVIYPNKKIEALYVRCWKPLFYRHNK
jgi:hypothetical protein